MTKPRNSSINSNKFDLKNLTEKLTMKYSSPVNFSNKRNSLQNTLKSNTTDKQWEFKYFKPSKEEIKWATHVNEKAREEKSEIWQLKSEARRSKLGM